MSFQPDVLLTHFSAKHQEIWDITSSLEVHKSEIADWELSAGIYIDFFILRNSMQEKSTMDDPVSFCFLQFQHVPESCG